MFTAAMLVTHINLISNNVTTVERFGNQNMHERENLALARLHSWWQFRCVLPHQGS